MAERLACRHSEASDDVGSDGRSSLLYALAGSVSGL